MPTRGVPDGVVRLLARFVPALRPLTPLLGRKLIFSSAKAHRMFGFAPRPGAVTVADSAESILAASEADQRDVAPR